MPCKGCGGTKQSKVDIMPQRVSNRIQIVERALGSAAALFSESRENPRMFSRAVGMLDHASRLAQGFSGVSEKIDGVLVSIREGRAPNFDEIFAMVVEHAGEYTVPVTRESCIECVEKHLGAACVQLSETREGYLHRIRTIGHLFEAEDESQEYQELHDAVRTARIAFQNGEMIPDFELLAQLATAVRQQSSPHNSGRVMEEMADEIR